MFTNDEDVIDESAIMDDGEEYDGVVPEVVVGDDYEEELDDDDEEEEEEEKKEEEEESQLDIEVARQEVDPLLKRSNTDTIDLIVPDNARITSSMLTRSELAYCLSLRAEEIANTATVFGVVPVGEYDPKKLAIAELRQRQNPLKIRRFIGYTEFGKPMYEEWKVRKMSYPVIGELL